MTLLCMLKKAVNRRGVPLDGNLERPLNEPNPKRACNIHGTQNNTPFKVNAD